MGKYEAELTEAGIEFESYMVRTSSFQLKGRNVLALPTVCTANAMLPYKDLMYANSDLWNGLHLGILVSHQFVFDVGIDAY